VPVSDSSEYSDASDDDLSDSPVKPRNARKKVQFSSDDSSSPERPKKQPWGRHTAKRAYVSSDSPEARPPRPRRNILDITFRPPPPPARPPSPVRRRLPLRVAKFDKSSSDMDDDRLDSDETIEDEEEDE
jgi:hypothetical protein